MISSKPSQYINGWVEFYKLRFKVTPDTLIPRPETELLIDEVLKYCNQDSKESYTILDLGTGSGNIAISIAKNNPIVKIIATDISEKALVVAKQNAKLHNVYDRITFVVSDLLIKINSGLLTQNSELIIVTNLPYIPSQRIPYLDSSVKDYEPHIALDGGEDGFELYRKLFSQINITPRRWNSNLKLILGEIDYTHGELAVLEAQKYFPDYQVEVKTDLSHLQRILTIKLEE